MAKKQKDTFICQICNKEKGRNEVFPADLVRKSIVEVIKQKHRDWNESGFICLQDLNNFRTIYIEKVFEAEKGELSQLESDVMRSLKEHELLTKNINAEFERKLTFGEKLSDKVAEFGGSWRFIIIFGIVLVLWITINSIALLKHFDSFPYILLNLILSCIAAIQAPIIMMSQNRQEAKDRMRSEHDYRVNLKAELEIRHLHEKMDHLISHQWQRLLEIQQIQTEIMEEIIANNSDLTP